MTDSPAPRIPLDPKEQPILDSLLAVRTKLELLKQDRSTYVKSQDVIDLYNEVIEQVVDLNDIRTTKRLEQNRGTMPSSIYLTANTDANVVDRDQWTTYWMTVSNSYHWRS